MSRLHVCSLRLIPDTVRDTGARSLVTLINVGTPVERPSDIAADRHLFIGVSDIVEPMDGHIHPAEEHVQHLLDFAAAWDRREPVIVHCYAGVSRSTAAAFIIACALAPERPEIEIARAATWKAAELLDKGDERSGIMTHVAKAKAGRVSALAVQEAVQMHGGIGMTDEHDIGLYMKREKVLDALFGDSNYHARMVQVMGRR